MNIYTYIYIFICTCIHAAALLLTPSAPRFPVYILMYTCIHIYRYTQLYMNIYMYMYTYIHCVYLFNVWRVTSPNSNNKGSNERFEANLNLYQVPLLCTDDLCLYGAPWHRTNSN